VLVDFAEKDGNYFLGLIDSHSKWIEVARMRSTTAQSTIDQMRLWFGLDRATVREFDQQRRTEHGFAAML